VDPDAPFDLALNERIQGPAVDLGCYESGITTGVVGLQAPAPFGYFDATSGELVFHYAREAQGAHYRVFATSGQVLAQGRVSGDRIRMQLTPGIHLLSLEGLGTLRFLVP
jgi:hypothetical protein